MSENNSNNTLLWKVELLPPNESELRTVGDALDSVTRKQQEFNRVQQQSQQSTSGQVDEFNRLKNQLSEYRVNIQQAEEAARFGNDTSEESIRVLEQQAIEINKLREEIDDYNLTETQRLKIMQQANARMKQTHLSTDRLENGFKSFNSQAGSANATLIETGRIASDLPFGFLGISNNIEAAMIQFARLEMRSDSTGDAFKALTSQLMSKTGLVVLAASIIPAAINMSIIGLRNWGESAAVTSNRQDELAQTTRDAVSAFDDLFGVTHRGADPAGLLNVEQQINALQRFDGSLGGISKGLQEYRDFLEGARVEGQEFGVSGRDVTMQVAEMTANLDEMLEPLGLTLEDMETVTEEMEKLEKQQRQIQARAAADPIFDFRVLGGRQDVMLIERFNMGLENTADGSGRVVTALREQRDSLETLQKNFKLMADTGNDDILPMLRGVEERLERINDALPEAPEKPFVEMEEPISDVIDTTDELAESLTGLDADFGHSFMGTLEQQRELTKDFRERMFDTRMGMVEDNLTITANELHLLQQIQDEAAEMGMENHQITEDLKTAISDRAAEERMQVELERERELTDAKMNMMAEVGNFGRELSELMLGESLAAAMFELAINKGLNIAEVIMEGNARVAEISAMANTARAQAGVFAAQGNFAQAAALNTAAMNAMGHAANVKRKSLQTAGVIAATGLLEGANTIVGATGGSGSSQAATKASGDGRGTGFSLDSVGDEFTNQNRGVLSGNLRGGNRREREVFVVQNNIDEKGVATMVRRGDRTRRGNRTKLPNIQR